MAQDDPLVSVIVAAYNAEPYITGTCRSVLGQTYAALEIIVIDDGSTDETANVVMALSRQDPRVRLIRQENRGVAAARNRGIAAASGQFIAPLDADDLWAPTKLERQVRQLRASGPQAGLAYCWWSSIDADGHVLDRSPRWRVEGRVLEKLVEVNFTGSASVPLYRKSCLEETGGYDADLRQAGAQGCEDWDLALRVAEKYGVAVVPAVLVAYRRHAVSMSTACDTMWRSQSRVLDAIVTRTPALDPSAVQRSAGQFALYLAGVSFWSGKYWDACRWALRARPITLSLRVLPHVVRILARRLVSRPRPGALDTKSMFDESRLPEPMIPYDRIYAAYWDGPGRVR